MRRLGFAISGLLVLSAMAACTKKSPDVVTSCMFDVSAPGTYVYDEGAAVPVVTPVEGGTDAGAEVINACIAGKLAGRSPRGVVTADSYAAAPRSTARPATSAEILSRRAPFNVYDQSACPGGASGMYGGVSYCSGE